jgi:hypothetical protein
MYVKNIIIPSTDKEIINQYLDEHNVSPLLNVLAFKRKTPHINYRSSHIDLDYARNYIKCSIVIPVAGFKNTGQIWYDGNYSTSTIIKDGYIYSEIKWNSPGIEIGRTEITSPTLVKTDIPHGVFSNGLEYRTACTIRFKNNEDFDYLADRLKY